MSYNDVLSIDPGPGNTSLEIYDKALEVDPSNVTALNKKGLLLFDVGKYDDAIPLLDRVLDIEP